jgi:hypothetical protein
MSREMQGEEALPSFISFSAAVDLRSPVQDARGAGSRVKPGNVPHPAWGFHLSIASLSHRRWVTGLRPPRSCRSFHLASRVLPVRLSPQRAAVPFQRRELLQRWSRSRGVIVWAMSFWEKEDRSPSRGSRRFGTVPPPGSVLWTSAACGCGSSSQESSPEESIPCAHPTASPRMSVEGHYESNVMFCTPILFFHGRQVLRT